MKTFERNLWAAIALSLLFGQGPTGSAEPMGAGFTYQGWITDGGRPAERLYDLQFKLFDAPADGRQIASTIEVNDVNVVDGHFAVEVDFCQGQQGRVLLDVFGGDARWLEIGARPALGDQAGSVQGPASEPHTLVGPRQKIATALTSCRRCRNKMTERSSGHDRLLALAPAPCLGYAQGQ